MDFMNRGERPVQQNTAQTASSSATQKTPGVKAAKFSDKSKLARVGQIGFLLAIAILIIAVLFSVVFSKNSVSKEAGYVDKSKLQAVFLNGGQVYFGNISDLNGKYLSMGNIYYLRVNQQVQPNQENANAANDISLVKLGCELHGPEDSMVINREQVIFWENLKEDGQVAKAVAEYKKANPNGQNCEQQQSNNNNQNADTSTTPTTNNNTAAPAANTTNNTRR